MGARWNIVSARVCGGVPAAGLFLNWSAQQLALPSRGAVAPSVEGPSRTEGKEGGIAPRASCPLQRGHLASSGSEAGRCTPALLGVGPLRVD